MSVRLLLLMCSSSLAALPFSPRGLIRQKEERTGKGKGGKRPQQTVSQTQRLNKFRDRRRSSILKPRVGRSLPRALFFNNNGYIVSAARAPIPMFFVLDIESKFLDVGLNTVVLISLAPPTCRQGIIEIVTKCCPPCDMLEIPAVSYE